MILPRAQLIACSACVLWTAATTGYVAAETRPNFVVILVDDLGYGDLGCYGSRQNDTPHIDRLAATGLRCTDFHSNGPMCSPTRAALLTGCYQQRFGRELDRALSPGQDRTAGLPLAAITIAEVLGDAGYATGMFGKWHLGYKPPLTPIHQGFAEFRGLLSGDGDHHTQIERSGREDWYHGDALDMEHGYTTDLITRHGVDFIKRHRDEPFFLYLAHLAIHFPWQGPEDPPHRVAGTDYTHDKWGIIPDRRNVAPHVKAMVEAVDASVGQILSVLESAGVDGNTLVVFASDNGGYLTYEPGGFANISSNGPLRGQKTEIHEGGHRVPAIFHWPGRIQPGVSDTLLLTMDVFPTLARLANISPPALPVTDGVDLAPVLFEREALPERTVCWRMDRDAAVRRGPWKLNLSDRRQPLLYHLDNDLGETTNLAHEQPSLVAELTAAYIAWETDVNRGPHQTATR